ncbi:uncharacterized protein LOC134301299 [Trichomycterus rosablanca]|uniref:uncharacterized protein LOC134301299 n=1 Tax=Trichomycterus rosablanca TaxID=2290929 RepID=UPI002F34FC2F
MWLHSRLRLFIILNGLLMSKSVRVMFPLKEPHYVALNKTLILEAQFFTDPGETISFKTWACKNSQGEVRLVTNGKATNSRTSVENQEKRLIIRPVTERDYGTYTFTVTNQGGLQTSDSVRVIESEKSPNASLALNCSVQREGALWDKPQYSWQVDGGEVKETAKLSEDGSTLYLSEKLNQNYTCVVESGQGTSRVQIKGPDQETQKQPSDNSSSKVTLITFVVLEAIVIVILLIYLIWLKNKKKEGVV